MNDTIIPGMGARKGRDDEPYAVLNVLSDGDLFTFRLSSAQYGMYGDERVKSLITTLCALIARD